MKLTQRTHPVREETYRRAFEQFTESPDFDWKERWPDGPFLALYRDNVYQIESPYDLRERAWLMLTSTDEAVCVPLSIWVSMARGVHHEAQFYVRLLNRLTTPDERKYLQLAFGPAARRRVSGRRCIISTLLACTRKRLLLRLRWMV